MSPGEPASLKEEEEDFNKGLEKMVEILKFFQAEGVAAVITPSSIPEAVRVSGYYDQKWQAPFPSFVFSREHYGRIVRMLDKKVPVKLSLSINATFTDNVHGFNVVAEIPGIRSGDRQSGGDARRPSRFMAHRHGRDRQRRRLRGGHGGGPAPSDVGREATPDDQGRALVWRGAGLLRFARLRDEALRQLRTRPNARRSSRGSRRISISTTAAGGYGASTCKATKPRAPIFEAWLASVCAISARRR